jgi:hypothetical protein
MKAKKLTFVIVFCLAAMIGQAQFPVPRSFCRNICHVVWHTSLNGISTENANAASK